MQERNFSYWLDLIVRRRIIALEAAGAVFGLVVLVTMICPPTYRSSAKILVQSNRAQYLVSPALQSNPGASQPLSVQPISQADLNSEAELLTSVYLAKEAVAGLTQPAGEAKPRIMSVINLALNLPVIGYDTLHHAPAISASDAWALKLSSHISADPVKLSNVLEVSFRSHDAHWSHDFLERLLNEYLAYHARISHDPEAEKFFNRQARLLGARLDASEDKLRQFEVQAGITDIGAQKQALVTRLSDLQIEGSRADTAAASAHQQISSLEAELKETPFQINKEIRSEQNNALAGLKPQLMELRAERAELLARYQPTSQRIQEIDAKIAAAQRILDQENHLEVREKNLEVNPVWVTLDTDLEQAKINEASQQAALNSIAGQIQSLRAQINQMTDNAVVLGQLERQAGADREAYMSYVRKSEEARTAGALNINKILNVSLAVPPTMPPGPEFPAVWFNLIGGFSAALMLGLLAAYWEEWRDDRIFSTVTIAEASGLSTVATLPDEA
jgi:polysaccharide biosynthesis protein PslE